MYLHEELLVLRKQEKYIGAQIIEKLQQLELSRQYLSMGYSSLFDYLVRGLNYSESAAYQKQSCVRLTKELPEIKAKLDSGALTSAGISMAFKLLRNKSTREKRELLKKIEYKANREIKNVLLEQVSAPQIKIVKTEYQDKVILRLELSKEQNSKLEKLKALNSHRGDMAKLFEGLIDKELKKYTNTAYRITKSRNPRFIAKTLRNYVLRRAATESQLSNNEHQIERRAKCQHPGCASTHFLQVDHIVPVRMGGKSNPENLQILCGAHNRAKA